MSNIARLRLGAPMILLLTLGLIWAPMALSAASDGPSYGATHPAEQAYSYLEQPGKRNLCTAYHRVEVGDNLTKLAAAYGVTIDALAKENGLDDSNLIRLDQLLCIPEATVRKQEYGHAKPGESYEPRVNGTEVEDGYRPEQYNTNQQYDQQGSSYAKPGESYEPPATSGHDQDYSSGYELKPGESVWSSD